MTNTKTKTNSAARKAMIDSQLRPSGVNAPFVLQRMAAIAREDFVPEKLKPIAYIDRSLPLGDGRFLPAPLFHGKLLSEAAPASDDHVLIVDNGSGYLAELCRPLVAKLDRIDAREVDKLAKSRKSYSLLLIDGAVEELPEPLVRRLADGGRIVTGLAEPRVTRLAIARKINGTVVFQSLEELGAPVIHEFDRPKAWQF